LTIYKHNDKGITTLATNACMKYKVM